MNAIRPLNLSLRALNQGRQLWGLFWSSLERNLYLKQHHTLSKTELCCSSNLIGRSFLNPILPTVLTTCGMKIKGRVRLRCKDCYFVVRQDRLYVMCKSKPRHKQALLKGPDKSNWILTHACQSIRRPW